MSILPLKRGYNRFFGVKKSVMENPDPCPESTRIMDKKGLQAPPERNPAGA